jgi:leader peptidase (prepilin peptidase)/N-methyltransferase
MAASTAVVVAALVAVGLLAGAAARIDAREHRLPNSLVLSCYPVVLLALACLAMIGEPKWLVVLLGLLIWALPIGLLWLLGGRRGMGPGDVKLAVPLGATLGLVAPAAAVIGIAAAFGVGGCFALVRMVRRSAARSLAFGPFMLAGWGIALLAHPFAP